MCDPDPLAILADAPPAPTFFDGFEDRILPLEEGHVRYRIGGEGPPILLLHGHPQTSAMWHRIAPDLARDHTVICPDLRGYGRSWKPAAAPDHALMSKRAMASDLLALMTALGHDRFAIGAHDRGARVGHRLAADHPDRVSILLTLDIAPTREMYAAGGSAFAADYWWWFWLIQPAPLPERMISADPDWYWCRKCCCGPAGATIFARPALEEYLSCWQDPATVASACEDYRAAHGIDILHDEADTTPMSVPVHALWGENGAIERHFDCIALWRERAQQVTGHALPGGHFLAEEVPEAVLAAWRPLLAELRAPA
ncbi:alpha/beta fold hydrolase [Jannaschia aquimarina]|uniref:DehH1 protein n=1 Tax=Jannaschia aquimarina TaxID=935700 RepID=A0A0D1EHA0_9RHOB|nr:alpha/beta hydrolase [Jannaschia aquimarina]KIT16246.1 Haloacetate dehalogenase H-1 [Jannaschia aquimarina]SNT15363.1 haloacetate dehalogenase [Jannaschia aquimarina]